jgi:hypothetical protein
MVSAEQNFVCLFHVLRSLTFIIKSTWYNILCDSSGNVVSIDLRNNYLWGETPLEISLLDKCGEGVR